MSHLKMDRFGNIIEIGFDGDIGIDEDLEKTQILAAYAQPENVENLSLIQEAATAAQLKAQSILATGSTTPVLNAEAVNPSVKTTVGNVTSWIKSIFANEIKPVLQSKMNIQSTNKISASPTEYTIAVEKYKTPSVDVTAVGQTVLQQEIAPVVPQKLRGLSRAAQVKAIAQARKEGKITKELSEEEKSILVRHPFLDIMKR
jgi:hypothetical protein